jgi:hypothetical protein
MKTNRTRMFAFAALLLTLTAQQLGAIRTPEPRPFQISATRIKTGVPASPDDLSLPYNHANAFSVEESQPAHRFCFHISGSSLQGPRISLGSIAQLGRFNLDPGGEFSFDLGTQAGFRHRLNLSPRLGVVSEASLLRWLFCDLELGVFPCQPRVCLSCIFLEGLDFEIRFDLLRRNWGWALNLLR